MATYSFVTTWRLDAPIEKVWEALYDSERWPSWWKGVEKVVELKKGGENGIGSIRRYTWKSKLPYRLTFDMRLTKNEKPFKLEGAAQGELMGTGRWELGQDGPVTTARYYWDVSTTRRWMNLLTPIARPLFKWNHDVVMAQGGEGIARLLGAKLRGDGES